MKNVPENWIEHLLRKASGAHKYDYGHAAIYAAPSMTGATRLASTAAARMGAGLVSVISTEVSAPIYMAALPAHIIVRDDVRWNDSRVTARAYGSGGMSRGVKIRFNRPCVLDADALVCMPDHMNDTCVLTPHEGEFANVFPNINKGSREERALAAAQKCGAIIVLKGQGSVIAHPDGRVCVNNHDSPHLASAGTGDVLAGMICGLLAQGMPAFEAACAGVWIHGEAGCRIGAGLVASDIELVLGQILTELNGADGGT